MNRSNASDSHPNVLHEKSIYKIFHLVSKTFGKGLSR